MGLYRCTVGETTYLVGIKPPLLSWLAVLQGFLDVMIGSHTGSHVMRCFWCDPSRCKGKTALNYLVSATSGHDTPISRGDGVPPLVMTI